MAYSCPKLLLNSCQTDTQTDTQADAQTDGHTMFVVFMMVCSLKKLYRPAFSALENCSLDILTTNLTVVSVWYSL